MDNKVLVFASVRLSTLPLVLDLRPGTVRWRLVSERQWDKELLIGSKSSSLRLLLISESNDSRGWSWFWLWLDITEAEIAKNFLDLGLGLVLKEEIEEREGLVNGILGLRVLGGFKLGIHWAIFSLCLCLRVPCRRLYKAAARRLVETKEK